MGKVKRRVRALREFVEEVMHDVEKTYTEYGLKFGDGFYYSSYVYVKNEIDRIFDIIGLDTGFLKPQKHEYNLNDKAKKLVRTLAVASLSIGDKEDDFGVEQGEYIDFLKEAYRAKIMGRVFAKQHIKRGALNDIFLFQIRQFIISCMECNKFYDKDYVFDCDGIPRCSCGGIIKPDVVLYEEGLDSDTIRETVKEISECDLLIIGGTSLNVYPAASFIGYFNGRHMVRINRDVTSYDNMCNLVIHDSLGKVFTKIKKEIC